MSAEIFTIKPYQASYRTEILNIWEQSVLATHHFLSPTDFEEIKQLVATINFNDFQVYCLLNDETPIGFIGIADKKIEMLFLSPSWMGKKLGQKLLQFAILELGAYKLDVNEQNESAVQFYRKAGFKIVERTDKDDQGRNYPLLRMLLSTGS